MLTGFAEYTRCADIAIESAQVASVDEPSTSHARHAPKTGFKPLADTRKDLVNLMVKASSPGAGLGVLAEIEAAIRHLRLERYVDNSVKNDDLPGFKSVIRKGYYMVRPLLPVAARKHLQRLALRGWDGIPFPQWPLDLTTESLIDAAWGVLLKRSGAKRLPFIWFWPDGHDSACMMTHDVETQVGRDFCSTMMQMERKVGIRSAFEIVPEERYPVSDAYLQDIRDQGCEICLHGLNHDGRLFSSEAIFLERAEKIKAYASRWGARGFRSPVMYRNLDWLHELGFSYDMSVPNVGHLDPQPGGCCTVMPYFIGNTLELPLTTIQDYSLFNILQQRSLDLWETQIAAIRARHGLVSFIIHPDYVNEPWSCDVYARLLGRLAVLRDEQAVWLALPGQIDDWWRARNEMRLVQDSAGWKIVGPMAERARVAYATLEKGKVGYRF